MIKHIFAIRIQNNLNEEKYDIITANAQDRGDEKGWRNLIADHVNADINADDHHIEDEHPRRHLKRHVALSLESQLVTEVRGVYEKQTK